MGCGKTTVGLALARLANLCFADTDDAVEAMAGMPVSEIFRRFGEAHFRELEHSICCELSQKDGLVIATGGGALTFPRNVQVLRRTGSIVLLDVPLEAIRRRLAGDASRPLLQTPDRDAAMQRLYADRLPLYRACADACVNGNQPPQEVALNIMQAVGLS